MSIKILVVSDTHGMDRVFFDLYRKVKKFKEKFEQKHGTPGIRRAVKMKWRISWIVRLQRLWEIMIFSPHYLGTGSLIITGNVSLLHTGIITAFHPGMTELWMRRRAEARISQSSGIPTDRIMKRLTEFM